MTLNQKSKLLKDLYIYRSFGFEYIPKILSVETDHSTKVLSWDTVEKMISSCYLCELSKTRTNTLVGNGNKNADIMIVGDAPSLLEDESGTLGVGRAGELLQRMIENVLNISQKDVYITNILKCKTINNESPSPSQTSNCIEYLFDQIKLIKPKIIITLGDSALQSLVGVEYNIENSRTSNILEYNNIPVIPTYNPNHLLRNPQSKKLALLDLLKVKDLYERLSVVK